MSETAISTVCVECEAELQLSSNPLIGEIVTCQECQAELEVISTEPVALQLAPEVEEDWGE